MISVTLSGETWDEIVERCRGMFDNQSTVRIDGPALVTGPLPAPEKAKNKGGRPRHEDRPERAQAKIDTTLPPADPPAPVATDEFKPATIEEARAIMTAYMNQHNMPAAGALIKTVTGKEKLSDVAKEPNAGELFGKLLISAKAALK